MGPDELNPYESPQSVAAEKHQRVSSPLLRVVVRFLAMGLIGFVSFSTIGFLYVAVAEYFQLEIFPSIAWALAVGGIGALIFTGSEVFNSGVGQKSGVLRRILVASGVFVSTGFVSSILTNGLDWNQQTYDSDPWWLHRLVLALIVFLAGLLVTRVLWIARS
jgi:H+/Cl- antiporter ClcA